MMEGVHSRKTLILSTPPTHHTPLTLTKTPPDTSWQQVPNYGEAATMKWSQPPTPAATPLTGN